MKSGMSSLLRTGLMVLFLGVAAAPARADVLFTPFLGVVFGGPLNNFDVNTLDDTFKQRFTFGGSVVVSGDSPFALEAEFSRSPNFFRFEGDDDPDFDLDSSIDTLMASVVIAPGGGPVRPYFVAGAGLMRANLRSPGELFDELSTNELGINLGGGVNVFFSDNIGLRGDLRYFRGLEQTDDDDPAEDDDFIDEDFGLEDFHFWRATIGLTFRFGG
jgi:opacity protein-like surface antigen